MDEKELAAARRVRGDAQAVADSIDAWLLGRSADADHGNGVLEALRARVGELGRAVERLEDAETASLYRELGRAETMEALHAGLDLLARRVQLLRRRRASRQGVARPESERRVRRVIRL